MFVFEEQGSLSSYFMKFKSYFAEFDSDGDALFCYVAWYPTQLRSFTSGNTLKRQLDSLRHEVTSKKQSLEDMRGKLEDLEDASNSQNIGSTAQSRQIRVLENRLDKAMIKYNEAQTIRRTYSLLLYYATCAAPTYYVGARP